MGARALVLIHCEPAIGWQGPFARKMQAGLKALGIPSEITASRQRHSDVAVLLGTTLWRQVEATGRYLLVDRASFGDPDYVSLVWDGHGRRGDHKVPEDKGDRWERMEIPLRPWQTGPRIVLCGQTETYSPHWDRLEDWYESVHATHFRPHPRGTNPTALPELRSWDDVGLAVTLNSSIGVETVMGGIQTLVCDEGGMAWDMSGKREGRTEWLRWLAWTQWTHDEIEAGISHLFEDL